MSLYARALHAFENAPVPDPVRRAAIWTLCEGARLKLPKDATAAEALLAEDMRRRPVAEYTEAANDQHYELPEEFFGLVLGPRRKYSCCLYGDGAETLEQAEVRALEETCAHADLAHGQDILELGCGWGSLSLWMAERYPASRITAVSNSASQRAYIEGQARARGLTNLTILTRDMNVFDTEARFDRIVSVEMFEHMANWPALLTRARTWLKPGGSLFIHVFSHRSTPYRFEAKDKGDWIGQFFFSGGVMPSHGLIRQFGDLFQVEQEWSWSGRHYERTALDWLANMDANDAEVRRVLAGVYGADMELWRRRWRLFFLATAGVFGHRGGDEWGVSHYRLKPVVEAAVLPKGRRAAA